MSSNICGFSQNVYDFLQVCKLSNRNIMVDQHQAANHLTVFYVQNNIAETVHKCNMTFLQGTAFCSVN